MQALSDKELSKKLELLVKTERITSVEVLLHLAELDERRLYVEEGYASLYSYCTRKLRYSEPSANRRIASARAGRRYPELFSLIAAGQLSLTTTSLMAGILNDGNKDELIQKCCDKSRAEVEAILSSYHSQTKTVERVRPVTVVAATIVRAEEPKVMPAPCLTLSMPCDPKQASLPVAKYIQILPEIQRAAVPNPQPKPEKRYVLSFSVSEEQYQKLEQVKSLISTKTPKDLSLEQVFMLLTDEYLKTHGPKEREERREARTLKQSDKPETGSNQPQSRHIPAKLRDQVFIRDQGCCSYVSPAGVRCGSRHNLQIDHMIPFARGGNHELANLRLSCSIHNRYFAQQAFGKEFMDQFTVPKGLNKDVLCSGG